MNAQLKLNFTQNSFSNTSLKYPANSILERTYAKFAVKLWEKTKEQFLVMNVIAGSI